MLPICHRPISVDWIWRQPDVTKLTTMKDAIGELVHDGDTIAIEGFTHLICFFGQATRSSDSADAI